MPTTVAGKTKAGYPVEVLEFVSFDDLTAFDGLKKDSFPGKGALATDTTANIFKLFHYCGIDTAFIAQTGPDRFLAYNCYMIKIEAVARIRVAKKGSYKSRHPEAVAGDRFPKPVVEFYLKTKDKQLNGSSIPCDDPLMRIREEDGRLLADLYHPKHEASTAKPFMTVSVVEAAFEESVTETQARAFLVEMAEETAKAANILDYAWSCTGNTFFDVKFEFGLRSVRHLEGHMVDKLLMADVVDADSQRVLGAQGQAMSKQGYRNGDPIEEVEKAYKRCLHETNKFKTHRARVARGLPLFTEYIDNFTA